MKKFDISPMPQYFDKYINLVKDIELLDAFESSLEDLYTLDTCLLEKIVNKTYLKDKWEIKEIIQHITDIERLLTSSVLRFSRNEPSFIISFDENRLTKHSKAKNKKLAYILEELISVRRSTICLYQNFDEEDLQKKGINWKYEISVLAMGFNIIGHQMHHLNFIKSNYYPLIEF